MTGQGIGCLLPMRAGRAIVKIKMPLVHNPRIEMLPLIDVVFLLLVVFIYAMLSSMAVHRGLPVRLPASSTAALDKRDQLTITVKLYGVVYVGQQEVPLDRLARVLKNKPGRECFHTGHGFRRP